ncbi:MAG: glutamine-hydrolyzing carbamoyl-phosphate synthase small subunit [Actinomycetota bacterium]|nr:glutamine-hydrolyzing carbamoyl-phosphate synthase small subunit [Actinomycetota bacterium]
MTRALLALEDGTIFRGTAFGADATITGELCFNTSMTGYQEVLTDPSYHGQVVTMTATQIGNTGTNAQDDQSRHPWAAGFVVRDHVERPSSWRAERSLGEYLHAHGVPGIEGVDTRRLTRHIRSSGAMRAALSTQVYDADELIERARSSARYESRDLVAEVSASRPYAWGLEELHVRAEGGYAAGAEEASATRSLLGPPSGERVPIAALDFGIKRNILDLLVAGGFDVTVLPASTSPDEILSGDYGGVFLSNGPGDPEPVEYAIATVAALVGRAPVFGICLGHQILALALGGRTFKLPFGHRGGNHPVKRLDHDRIEITCQNHGFAVDPASLASTGARLTHVNLNDGTVEGLEVPGSAFSVQYHPESGPGPHDSRYLFDEFRRLIAGFEPQRSKSAEADGRTAAVG